MSGQASIVDKTLEGIGMLEMTCKLLRAGALLGFAVAMTVPATSATIVNGSLTGPAANANVPTGWTVLVGSPDTNDITHNVGSESASTFGATPSASPDGGSWVGMAADSSSGFVGRFGQTVTDLSIGSSYQVSWYAANFGYTAFGYINPASVQLLVNGVSVGFGGSLAMQPGWTRQSLTFTATATSEQLAFSTSIGPRSYLSIDGIAIAAVPEAGTAVSMGAGLAGLAASMRRNRGTDPT